MTILFDFTFLENDLSFFIVKQNRHAPAKWYRKRVRKGCFEKKIYEKLRAKGHFDFKTPFARVRKGAFEKKTTKNYARRAISILKHPFARVRKGAFEKNYEKLRAKGYFNFKTPFAHARKGLLLSG